MSTVAKNAKQLTKEQAECANFEGFLSASPNFSGRQIASYGPGGDPPDILCIDGAGKRIGVELVQWINEMQTGPSKERFRLERSFMQVIRSWEELPPQQVGMVFINSEKVLQQAHAVAFRTQLYAFIATKNCAWPMNPEWDDPQGWSFNDFSGFPLLGQYLHSLEFYSRSKRFNPSQGSDWIQFHAHGGAYTSDWMRDALLNNVRAKVAKYKSPKAQEKLAQERLDEFDLLVYYDEAAIHNTPYHSLKFSFADAAAAVAAELSASQLPFDQVFLFSSIELAQQVIRVWPIV